MFLHAMLEPSPTLNKDGDEGQADIFVSDRPLESFLRLRAKLGSLVTFMYIWECFDVAGFDQRRMA